MLTAFPKPIDATVSAVGGGGNDTLGLDEFLLSTPSLFGIPDAGYATGTLLSVDTFDVPPIGPLAATTTYQAFGEGHFVDEPHNVLGAMFFLGALSNASGDPTTEVVVNMHLVEDNMAISNPATVQSPDIAGPGQVLDSKAVVITALNDTNSGGFAPNFVDFDNTPWVSQDIIIALNISDVYSVTPNDTVAVLSTNDGEGDGEYTFHLVDQQVEGLGGAQIWAPTSAVIGSQGGSGIDINLALFPIVAPAVGIEEARFFNGIRTSVYPNPTNAGNALNIRYELEKAANGVTIEIYSTDGKRVARFVEGTRNAGKHQVTLETGLASGTYVYSILADSRKIASRIVVTD